MTDIIVRYAEVALKGKNRSKFERRLVENIRDCIGSHERIIRPRGRIIVVGSQPCPELRRVFGISSFSFAISGEFSLDAIKRHIDELGDYETFRISANRVDKSVQTSSMEMNRELGQYVVDKHKKKVSLNEFDMNICIELIQGRYYFFTEKHDGPGGLPLGTNGKALALIQDQRSVVAAWMLMRRGVRPVPIAEDEKAVGLLQKFNYGFPELRPEKGDVALIAERKRINALIVGQTLHDIEDVGLDMLVLRPLVGMSKAEIEEKYKTIESL